MGRNSYFQFKKFKIVQENAAMKVGTDGVLLGAWARVGFARTILDVGTGTGLIAIMMAQRSESFITGIEIEEKAAGEAAANAFNSPWGNRIEIFNVSLQNFAESHKGFFDLIISNPPFFSNSKKSKCEMLAMAKHNHHLPYSDLINCAARLLNKKGRLALILPAESNDEIKVLAEKENLFLLRETEVRPNIYKKPHRFLFEFGKSACQTIEKDVIQIHKENKLDISDNYKHLVEPFYLGY